MTHKVLWGVGGAAVLVGLLTGLAVQTGHRRFEEQRLRAMRALGESRAAAAEGPRVVPVPVRLGGMTSSADLRCTLRVTGLSSDGVQLALSLGGAEPQAYPPLPPGRGVTLVGPRDSCRVRVLDIRHDVAVVSVTSVLRSRLASPLASRQAS